MTDSVGVRTDDQSIMSQLMIPDYIGSQLRDLATKLNMELLALMRQIVEDCIKSGDLPNLSFLTVQEADEPKCSDGFLAEPKFSDRTLVKIGEFAERIKRPVNVVILAILIDGLQKESFSTLFEEGKEDGLEGLEPKKRLSAYLRGWAIGHLLQKTSLVEG